MSMPYVVPTVRSLGSLSTLISIRPLNWVSSQAVFAIVAAASVITGGSASASMMTS